MAQQQVITSGGLAALACYTVDSDSDTEEEDEKKVDFGDLNLAIKEEPVWSLDTDGHKDPQDLIAVPDFSVVQVKQEIVTDSESSDSDCSEDEDEVVKEKEKEEEVEKELPPKTKNELGLSDLPAVEDMDLKVRQGECQAIGLVSSMVDQLLVIESLPDLPALDLESVLFAKEEVQGEGDEVIAIGRVFDVIGPVTRPYYCVRFNSEEHIRSKNLTKGQQIFFAPKTEHTTFVFLEQLMKMKISDASWCNDEELPPDFQEFSDDEQESKARQKKKIEKMVEKGVDPSKVEAKKARMEAGRARHEQRHNDLRREGGENPRVNNGLYAAHVNPFYRQQRSYDPRTAGGGIRWTDYSVPQQQRQPLHPHTQQELNFGTHAPSHYHPIHHYQRALAPSPFSVPPPPLPSFGQLPPHYQPQNFNQQLSNFNQVPPSYPSFAAPPPPPPPE